MKDKRITNVAASIRQRLLNLARQRGEPFDFVLGRYGTERLLYRLSQSQHADEFVLKGAVLFQLWSDEQHRPTRDLDLLGKGEPSPDRFVALFAEVCQVQVEDDGMRFDPDTIRAAPIKEEDEYQGIRVKLGGSLDNARAPLQIDIGFGDAITPGPVEIDFPTLLGQPAPKLRAYPRETVVAEKYQAMVMLGMANSRMKDFYDLWTLAREFKFDGPMLCDAIRATFTRRQTELPATLPVALTAEFHGDAAKGRQWSAFLLKGSSSHRDVTLTEVAALLQDFLAPPSEAIRKCESFASTWQPTGPWQAS